MLQYKTSATPTCGCGLLPPSIRKSSRFTVGHTVILVGLTDGAVSQIQAVMIQLQRIRNFIPSTQYIELMQGLQSMRSCARQLLGHPSGRSGRYRSSLFSAGMNKVLRAFLNGIMV